MARVKEITSDKPKRRSRPALTPEAREKQLVALAYDLAEEHLRNGTATSQEITHFLKLGSTKNQLEMELLRKETELKEAKTSAINDQKRIDELYANAIAAMRSYSGLGEEDGGEDIQ